MNRLRSPNGDRLGHSVNHFRVRSRTLLLRAATESGGDGVVELDGDYVQCVLKMQRAAPAA
jgi:hypothetical protein